MARLDPLLVVGVDDRQVGHPPKVGRKSFIRALVAVLHHYDRHAEVVRKTREDLLQRVHSTERATDDDQLDRRPATRSLSVVRCPFSVRDRRPVACRERPAVGNG
jgi:hypothetical protein